MSRSSLRALIDSQVRMSRALTQRLPEKYRIDGNSDFAATFAPKYLKPGMTIYDVGGGKHSFIDAELKARLGVRVVGLDIDAGELSRAPAGCYDETVCADITA